MGRRNMKSDQIKKLADQSVKKWKSRLEFSGWKIDVKITTFKRADNFPQDGDIVVDYPKKKATILIGTIRKAPIEKIVVHELVHLMLWPLDQNAMLIIKAVKRKRQKKAEENFLGKLEKVVDRITKTFLRLRK